MKKKKLTPETIENLIEVLGKVKDLKRSGWKKRNVSLPESDADHSFGMCALIMMYSPDNLNKGHCLELAIVHDMAEIHSGDFTPGEITSQEKARLEKKGMRQISQEIKNHDFYELFKEFEAQQTPEAKFVRAIDKLETVLTAKYYDNNGRSSSPNPLMPEFAATAAKALEKIDSPDITILREILNIINK